MSGGSMTMGGGQQIGGVGMDGGQFGHGQAGTSGGMNSPLPSTGAMGG